MFDKKIIKYDFTKAPIFYICPVCGETCFGYFGNANRVGEIKWSGKRLFRCNNCNIVITEP